jgi:penicillin-binding protein 1A
MEQQYNNGELNPQEIRDMKMPIYKKTIKWFWRVFIAFFALSSILFLYLSFTLPSFEELENPKINAASEIYSADGVLLGKFYVENRSPVPYDSISLHVINALVATEDARFYRHSGIDPEALARVGVKTLLLRRESAGGGSTISQQLAKLLVGRPDTRKMFFVFRYWTVFTTKLKEWLTAVKLERSYTKKEILTIYLNKFDFLFNAHGIRSAAETYFAKHPYDLDINESAMLVRMLKNPSMYNFRRDKKVALKGREVVLKNMMDKGHISRKQYDELRVQPIDASKFKVQDHNEGMATYFREYLREHLKEMLSRSENLKSDGTQYDLYRDGLKIYTTIDSRMQMHLEHAVWDHLSQHQDIMFKQWPDWNMPDPAIGTSKQNPWTYREYSNTISEIELRLLNFNKLLWESDRWIAEKQNYFKIADKHELSEADIYRMIRIENANKNPYNDNYYNKKIDGDSLMRDWKKSNYISEKQYNKYRTLLKSSDWNKIRAEYEAIIKYMKKPVEMKVFSYIKSKNKWRAGDKDTLLSPFDSIRYHRMFIQAGSVAIDPKNGHVKAWAGGIDHHYFKLDHVSMGALYVHPKKRLPGVQYKNVGRQVGSSIKPFLYGLTIEQKGYSPCYEVDDVKLTIEKGYQKFGLQRDWTPSNAGGGYSGQRMTLTKALSLSLNSVSAQLMKDFGSTVPFRLFLHTIGIDSSKVPASPTICLGTPDLTPLEMTAAYTIFASGGFYHEPIFVTKIVSKNGSVIYSDESNQINENILAPKYAYTMSSMLQSVQAGAPGFHGIKSQHGGKTGTTNFQADGWYIGITPNLIIGTWAGNDDRFIRFRNIAFGQGGAMSRPIFQNALRSIEADKDIDFDTKARFPKPEGDLKEMDCNKYDKLGNDTYDYTESEDVYSEDLDNNAEKKKAKLEKKKKEAAERVIDQ